MVTFPFFQGLVLALFAAVSLQGQASADLERRVSRLEEQMRSIDPSFAADLRLADTMQRLEALEKKMAVVLASKPAAEVPPPVKAPAVSAGETQLTALDSTKPAALTPVSVTGNYEASSDKETRLPVSGYMDFHVNKESGESFRPDLHRFVLLFGHSFSERIKFWSELEVEHALVEGGEPAGEVAVEQAYLDFLVKPYFNLRAGMLLTPIGIVNERHEPPAFNGVERPFVETLIVPTTWRELGFGFTGDLGRGFRYRAYITSSLDASRFDAENGIAEGRTAGFDSSLRNPAKVARLEFAGVRRLTLGTSIYSGHTGFNTPGINPGVTISEFDGRYRFGRFDFRGLFANVWVGQAAELNRRIRLQTGRNPNIAREMRGYYVEPAFHVLPQRNRNDLILFGRYEAYNTQHRMPIGYVALPQFDRSSWIAGATYKPHADVALKFDYVFNRNASSVVRTLNGINLGIGWWF